MSEPWSKTVGAWERRWLPRERLRLWVLALLAVWLGLLAIECAKAGGLWFLSRDGQPLPYDFLAFRTAGIMAVHGEAATAYDFARFAETVSALTGGSGTHPLAWLNPPNFLLVLAPLALLPYTAAWFAWTLSGATLFGLVFRQVAAFRGAALVGLAAPSAYACFVVGQSSFLSAGLLGLGLLLCDRRPLLGGALIGCVSFKPVLGLVLPVVLAAGGRWRAFLAAAAAVLILMLASAALFGADAWRAYFETSGFYGDFSLHRRADGVVQPRWPHLQSVYTFVLTLSGNAAVAGAAHAVAAAPAVAAAAWTWHRDDPLALRAASALCAGFLATPYVHSYDALSLTMAMGFLLRHGRDLGFLPGDIAVLGIAFLLPGAVFFIGFSLWSPAAAALLLLLAVRQARRETRPKG